MCLSGCATIRKFNPLESKTLEARRLTKEAESLLHSADLHQAEEKLFTAIERDPADNHAREVLADVLWQRGDTKAAVEQMSKAVQFAGRQDATQLTQLGQMLLSTGDSQAALRRAEEAIAAAPNHADAWTLKGFALRDAGRSADALGAFFRSLSLRNDDMLTRFEIAKIYFDEGKSQRALAILGSPCDDADRCPHYADVCHLRGLLFQQLERPADAILALKEARDAGESSHDLIFAIASAQLELGEFMHARATLTEAAIDCPPEQQLRLAELQRQVDSGLPAATSVWR